MVPYPGTAVVIGCDGLPAPEPSTVTVDGAVGTDPEIVRVLDCDWPIVPQAGIVTVCGCGDGILELGVGSVTVASDGEGLDAEAGTVTVTGSNGEPDHEPGEPGPEEP
jgi:hypothetical protein